MSLFYDVSYDVFCSLFFSWLHSLLLSLLHSLFAWGVAAIGMLTLAIGHQPAKMAHFFKVVR
ncbi:MAG: hypothetical protein ACRC8Q_03060 [Aeromonas sp.]